MNPHLYNWNEGCPASIPTAIGPTVATAVFKATSLPWGMFS